MFFAASGTASVIKFFLNPRVLAFIGVGLSIFMAYSYVKGLNNKIEKLEREKSTLVSNNEILKDNNLVLRENVKTLAISNHENWKTAQALLLERSQAQVAINNLSVATKNDRMVINKLNQQLEEIIKNPLNDGAVSPALRETVRSVQETRRK